MRLFFSSTLLTHRIELEKRKQIKDNILEHFSERKLVI